MDVFFLRCCQFQRQLQEGGDFGAPTLLADGSYHVRNRPMLFRDPVRALQLQL